MIIVLLGSAIARVRWELSIEQIWKRDPEFYVDQTLGSVFALLLQPPPFSPLRQQQIVDRMRQIPATIQAAKQNLTDIRQPFAELAIAALDQVSDRTRRMETALAPQFTSANNQALQAATPAAVDALNDYRAWLQKRLPNTRKDTAIGRENYLYFLRNVALISYTPEQLLAMSRQEWSRSVAFETYQQERLSGLPPAPIFSHLQTHKFRPSKSMRRRFVRSLSTRRSSPSRTGFITTAICCCRTISIPTRTSESLMTSPDPVASTRMEPATSGHLSLTWASSTSQRPAIHDPSSCMKAYPAITFSCASAGTTPTQSAATTMIPARTRASASMRKR